MFRTRLLTLLLTLSSSLLALAQDPGVGGFVVTSPLMTGSDGTVKVNILNGSSTPIPQANNASWTISLPPNIGLIGGTAGVSISPTATNFTTTASPYDATIGTTVTLTSNLGPVPGNAAFTITLNVRGVQPGANAPISISTGTNPPVFTNVPGNDLANTTITVNGALPVSLIAFTATPQSDHTVRLDWSTSMETNNKGFTIERSTDLRSFALVGELREVALTSAARSHYQLTDPTPYTGTSYYRLSQTDLSGAVTRFPVVSVVLREEAYGVYPNPVISQRQFVLRLDEPQTATIGLFSTDGQALSVQKTGVESGKLLLTTSGSLPAGVYVLTVEERGLTRQHRLVIP